MNRDLRFLDQDELQAVAGEHPYPLLFATVSGAHLYGFPSRDSDVDLRGVHLLPVDEVVGLRPGPATVDRSWMRNGAEIDLVTHDAVKFFVLLLRRNGYVLEQLLSPLVVVGGPVHEELLALAPACLTRHHAHHYRGFATTQQRLYARTGELKPLLYSFRVLLTGIRLMNSRTLIADLPTLIAEDPAAPPYLADLVTLKAEQEHGPVPTEVTDRCEADLAALSARLDQAEQDSALPDRASAEPALHDLLIRLRLGK